jgi:flavodoxin
MKTLVVYYSRTGHTRDLAQKISEYLKCDREEIEDTRNRKGLLGYLFSGRDATFKRLTQIRKIEKDPLRYDLVVIGTPIWAWNVSAPVRTFLTQYKNKLKKVAFFCTHESPGVSRVFAEMERLCGQKPLASLDFVHGALGSGNLDDKLKKFIVSLRSI